jgi:glucose-1-phosphatase
MQRTIATAQYFSSGMLPVANIEIEHHYDVGTMDPVFTPQLTVVSDDYREQALKQIADLFGDGSIAGIGQKMAANYALLEQVLDMSQSVACTQGDSCAFKTDDTVIKLELNKEPGMSGGLKLACSASDALVLQYYEQQDDAKADFGHQLQLSDWEQISAVKDWYGDVLFTAPLVAVNVAHPLLQEILAELKTAGRKFTFLCGHDSNIGSVLASIGVTDYALPEAIEKKTPIGSKLVVEKWLGTDGRTYAAVNLCYQSIDQLRHLQLLSLENPPTVFQVVIDGLTANDDGLYLLDDLMALLGERISQYDELTTAIAAPQSSRTPDALATPARIFRLDGTPATADTTGVVIRNGKKVVVR